MQKQTLLVLLGNQLFQNAEISALKPSFIFMAEDYELCTYEKHHKLKILMFLGAMREKRDELINTGFNIEYQDINHPDFKNSYEQKLKKILNKRAIKSIKMFEIEDKEFEDRIKKFSTNLDCPQAD